MHHQARLVLGVGHLPDFLDADAVVLRILSRGEIETGDQLFAEMAAAALCEQGVPGVQFHARGVAVLVFAVHADTHVSGGDP